MNESEMNPRIVIGYDGSANGADALELGRQLCGALGAEPVVFFCLQLPRDLMGRQMIEDAVEGETEAVFQAARKLLPGLEARTELAVEWSPARALFEFAEAEKPPLMVVGSAHQGLAGRILLGSVGQRLVEGLPCALAVAPHGYAGAGHERFAQLGVGLDEGPESSAALRAAVSLATRLEARLRLISVQTPPKIAYTASPGVAIPDLDRAEERRASGVLEQAIEAVPSGLAVDTLQLKGDPANCLETAAKELDLLVIGSRGYGPLRRILLGTTSATLMRTAPCPVVVIPRAAGEDPLEFEASGSALTKASA
jgi:nucleotide-binding universal stress UspA family protein